MEARFRSNFKMKDGGGMLSNFRYERHGYHRLFAILAPIVVVCGMWHYMRSCDKAIWRKDAEPIITRFPSLATETNLYWKMELLTKQTFFSVPGPSAYRIKCFAYGCSTNLCELSYGKSHIALPSGMEFPRKLAVLSTREWFELTMPNLSYGDLGFFHGQAFYEPKSRTVYLEALIE